MAGDARFDLLVVGGGINGAGIARDAAGRGLRVALLERGDPGEGTSSASTKLVHGGLRYLEFGAVGMVRKALVERERILASAPQIAWPLPFLLPVVAGQGGRPAWMLRLGLKLYDVLARGGSLPRAQKVQLQQHAAGPAFRSDIRRAWRFWDGWVDDSRLVILNLVDAARRGADIRPREGLASVVAGPQGWEAVTSAGRRLVARQLVNAAGPWAADVARLIPGIATPPRLRLVQGTHIVTRKVHRTADAWILQQPDGRMVFAIPYEGAFSLIGTTETALERADDAGPRPDEEAYLLAAVNRVLRRPIGEADIVHRFAGVRPLVLEEGKDARETTRDWRVVRHEGLDATTIIGGKLTTYRLLAEDVLGRLFPRTARWTADAPLPGGDIPGDTRLRPAERFAAWQAALKARHALYDPALVERLSRTWGTRVEPLLDGGLGANLGGVFEAEVDLFCREEWARSAEDILWRRTKWGLTLEPEAVARVRALMGEAVQG